MICYYYYVITLHTLYKDIQRRRALLCHDDIFFAAILAMLLRALAICWYAAIHIHMIWCWYYGDIDKILWYTRYVVVMRADITRDIIMKIFTLITLPYIYITLMPALMPCRYRDYQIIRRDRHWMMVRWRWWHGAIWHDMAIWYGQHNWCSPRRRHYFRHNITLAADRYIDRKQEMRARDRHIAESIQEGKRKEDAAALFLLIYIYGIDR